MTARFAAMQQHSNYCASSAAVGTSVRVYAVLDTVILAVSIFILILVHLLGLYS